jgi:hypothetical protein
MPAIAYLGKQYPSITNLIQIPLHSSSSRSPVNQIDTAGQPE